MPHRAALAIGAARAERSNSPLSPSPVRSFNPITRSPPVLVVRHLYTSCAASEAALTDINLEIGARGVTAVIGPSGAGKGTLIRCIHRVVESAAGEILLDGRDLARLAGTALRESRRHIGMVPRECSLVRRLTAMENLLSGEPGLASSWRAWRRKFPPNDIRKAIELLDLVRLSDFANGHADALSRAQRQRVGIARALMREPKLLLADDPTASLEPGESEEVMKVLADTGRVLGIPVLINMHDADLAKRFAHRIVGMAAGKIVFDGAPAYLTGDVLRQIYGGEGWLR